MPASEIDLNNPKDMGSEIVFITLDTVGPLIIVVLVPLFVMSLAVLCFVFLNSAGLII
jgi:hypothetical protein